MPQISSWPTYDSKEMIHDMMWSSFQGTSKHIPIGNKTIIFILWWMYLWEHDFLPSFLWTDQKNFHHLIHATARACLIAVIFLLFLFFQSIRYASAQSNPDRKKKGLLNIINTFSINSWLRRWKQKRLEIKSPLNWIYAEILLKWWAWLMA